MADEWEQALGRVQEAMDRVVAAWEADYPGRPIHTREPRPPAWHPDPDPDPVTTRQWAEVTCLRASSLLQEGLQVRGQAAQLYRATLALHAFPHQPPQDHDPGHFVRIGPAILVPHSARHRW